MTGQVRVSKCVAELNGITSTPSAHSTAVRVITGPSAPSSTGGGPNRLGPGLNSGGIRSSWVCSPR